MKFLLKKLLYYLKNSAITQIFDKRYKNTFFHEMVKSIFDYCVSWFEFHTYQKVKTFLEQNRINVMKTKEQK